MRKIVMKTLLAGPGGSIAPGQEVSMPDERAKALVDNGYAEYVKSPAKAEKGKEVKEDTATAEAPEHTGRETAKRRKAGKEKTSRKE